MTRGASTFLTWLWSDPYAETQCIEVEETLEVSLEEFWTDVINSDIEYDGYPTWLDFLEWVRDYG